jgi:hypothetical protein
LWSRVRSNFSFFFIDTYPTLIFGFVNPFYLNPYLAPPDALEVALLDANTLAPLVGTTIGLTQTDSLLNLQADGTAYYGDSVKVPGATISGNAINLNGKRTISVDVSHLDPGTKATLDFDL